MGLSSHTTRFFLQCWREGLRFERVLTLGVQDLLVGPERLERLLAGVGAWPPAQGVEAFRKGLREGRRRFAVLAQALGAREVQACDASAYEGAECLHDLNQPIPAAWEQQYDLVVDGGTLEHVFNFPVAVANCMRWLRPGGHLLCVTPANNFSGHGFYQFSPELFYRVLSAANGFEVRRVVAAEDAAGFSRVFGTAYAFPVTGPWHEVHDPDRVGARVTLMGRRSVLLYVLARKDRHVSLFATPPQQSDYTRTWRSGEGTSFLAPGLARNPLLRWALARFGESFCREWLPRLAWFADPLRWWRFRREHSFANRRFYRPFPEGGDSRLPEAGARGREGTP